MAHLKHSGPVSQAAHAKRTALIEIYSNETAANEVLTAQQRSDAAMFTEEQLLAGDRINAEGKAIRKGDRDFCRAMDLELQKLGIQDAIGGR